jgi:hypothetical protein
MDAYKIGKHKVPSLNEIIFSLIGAKEKNIVKKRNVLNTMHHFLLTGKKEIMNIENENAIYDTKKPYAILLNLYLDQEGYYDEDTPNQTKALFTYNKQIEIEGEPTFKSYIQRLQKEINVNVGNVEHLEEIVAIEKFFYKNKECQYNKEDCHIEDRKKECIAWYSKFERIGQFHYHLAKKQSKKEDLYFASQIDLATDDTLYYLALDQDFSFMFITLYLNLQNIDMQKENLSILVMSPNGEIDEVKIKKMDNETLDNIVYSYKNKNPLTANLGNIPIEKDIKKSLNKGIFFKKDYVISLIPTDNLERPLGFYLWELIENEELLKKNDDIKIKKYEILTKLILFLKMIEKVSKKYSVEYTLLFIEAFKRLIATKEIYTLLYSFEDFTFLDNIIKGFQGRAQKLGNALKSEEKKLLKEGAYEVKYKRLTLDLMISEIQEKELMQYLTNNLIVSKKYEPTSEEEEESSNKDDNELDISQIINIKEKKKLATLKGKEVNLTGLYKKESGYYGCIQSDKYIDCKIVDVSFFYTEKKGHERLPRPIAFVVEMLEKENETSFNFLFNLFDTKSFNTHPLTKDEINSINETQKIYNTMLTHFFDTFSIKRGEFNFSSWIGKEGRIAIATDNKDENGNKIFKKAKGKGIMSIEEEEEWEKDF